MKMENQTLLHGGSKISVDNVFYFITRKDGTRLGPFKVANVTLDDGRNVARQQLHDPSYALATTVAQYVAVTQNGATPTAGDSTLTGEETLHGLARAAATYSSLGGTGQWQLEIVYTYTDVVPITLAKAMVFDDPSAGNGYYEALLSPTATLNTSGDTLTLIWQGTVQAA